MKKIFNQGIFLLFMLFIVSAASAQCEKKATAIKWLQGKQDYFIGNYVIDDYEFQAVGLIYSTVQWTDLTDVKITNLAKEPDVYTLIELITSRSNTHDTNSPYNDYRVHYYMSVKNEMVQRVINALKDIKACNNAGEPY